MGRFCVRCIESVEQKDEYVVVVVSLARAVPFGNKSKGAQEAVPENVSLVGFLSKDHLFETRSFEVFVLKQKGLPWALEALRLQENGRDGPKPTFGFPTACWQPKSVRTRALGWG